jgi:Asparagine synthase
MVAAKHFFAYLPSGRSNRAEISRLSAVFGTLGYRTTDAEQSFLLGCVSPSNGLGPLPAETEILHMTPGAEIKIRTELAAPRDGADIKRFAFDTVRIFNLLCSKNASIEIVSDPLSLLPYYTASVEHGTLVCSSIRHIFAAVPGLSKATDDQAVFEFLCCGTPFGSRTLHKRVAVSSAGQVLRWDPARGLAIDRSGRTNVLPADPSIAASAAVDQIAGHIQDSFSKLPSPVLLPLTGGFDSRLIACFAASRKLNARMVTLGYPWHDEIRVANAVAQTLGGKTTVFPPPYADVLDLVPLWLECLEGFADMQTLFMANLLSFPEPEGTPLYHGFIGDTLSGGLLNWIPIETATGPQEVARGAANYFFAGVSARAGDALHLSASVDGGVNDILTDLVEDVAPHQAFTLWNLENIQRRRVGNQLLYLGQRFMPVPVFYYRPLMEFWLSMPRMALEDRTLLAFLFKKNFPQVATLPHSDRVPTVIPRTVPALKYSLGWALRLSAVRILHKMKFNTEKLETRSYIWPMWHGTTTAQQKKEQDRLEETLGLLQSRLGWNAPRPTDTLWAASSSVEQNQLLMLRRLYLLGEYAKSLPEPI